MTPKPIILDTDIGTDVDDLLALSVILNSPEARPGRSDDGIW